ncbi:ground-like domain-containing protein [Ditylenchus destructor]|nr:ground-like domain-containing protein [Ditylenchus destructor]
MDSNMACNSFNNLNLFSNHSKRPQAVNQEGDGVGLPAEPAPINNFPLAECYRDSDGYMCCNMGVEADIRSAFDGFTAERIKRAGEDATLYKLDQISAAIQRSLEERYCTTFEVVVGNSDFASKSHFYENFLCKVRHNGRVILAYGTPKNSSETRNVLSETCPYKLQNTYQTHNPYRNQSYIQPSAHASSTLRSRAIIRKKMRKIIQNHVSVIKQSHKVRDSSNWLSRLRLWRL